MDVIQQLNAPDYLTGYAESRIGGRSENQDSYGSAQTPYGFVVTVCDGMGGGPGGKTASSIAVYEIITGIREASADDTPANIVIKAIRRANLAIIAKGEEDPSLRGMGSTCTVLLISEECAIAAHVGDSRVYQLRGRSKVFRTFDHSMVFDLVRQKVITEEQARLSAQSNVITRALGVKPDIEVDVAELPYEAGDRFLLTTDGIHGSLPENELIEKAADRKRALGTVADEIATHVDGKGRSEGGGHDNLTLALVEAKINSKLKSKMNKKAKILLCAVGVVCLASLVCNFVQLGRKAPVPADAAASVEQVDSLRNIVHRQDSVIGELTEKIKSAGTATATATELAKQVAQQKEALKRKSDSIAKYVKTDKALREEIQKLKKKK